MPEKKGIQVARGARVSISIDASVRFSAVLYQGENKIYEMQQSKREGGKIITMDQDKIILRWLFIPAESVNWSFEVCIRLGGEIIFQQKSDAKKDKNGKGKCILVAEKKEGGEQ